MTAIADVSDRSIDQLISLAGRTCVVTGGARGLGRAIASRLMEAGANALIADLDAATGEAAAAELSSQFQGRCLFSRTDVTDATAVEALADLAVESFGGIDVWVNNAGVFPFRSLDEMDADTWDTVMAVNTRGVMLGSREAARHMTAAGHGGTIINIASTAGFRGVSPGLSAYVASKHAVRGLTRQLALELAPHAIRVLGIAPTYCVTEGNLLAAQEMGGTEVTGADIAAMVSTPLGRVGVPDDVARAALFCASDLAIFMTGSTLLVDAAETA
ncbi:MAG: glucose 1-dehydrogenase [Halioglobus sp.]|nr:glucose 1-dehydrogenase [Halioglobus sp.]